MPSGEESPEFPGSRAGTSGEYRGLGKRKSPKSSTIGDNNETVRSSVPGSSRMSHPAFGRQRSDERNNELLSSSKRQRSESRKRSIVNEAQLRQAENVVQMDDEDGDIFSSDQLLNESRLSGNETNESREQLGCKIAAHCLGSNLSSEDLSSHLASCIQLNTANKINKNNAFSLQLIDYMCVLMARNDKTINDFPTMSCSLDASSKIYACRVDCVHSGIMEIATGLSSVTERPKRTTNRMDDSDQHSEEVQRRGRRRKPKNTIAPLEAICRRSIDMGHWVHRPAIQPDFTSLLTHASITQSHKSCLSLLQDDTPLVPKRKTKQPPCEKYHTVPFDLSKGTNLLGSGWEDYGLFGDECNNNYNNLLMNDITSIDPDETSDKDASNQRSCDEEEVNIVGNDLEIVGSQEGPDSSNDSCSESGDNLGIVERVQCSRKKSRLHALDFVNSRALQAPDESIYSYFDTDLLPDLWAGPEYWKPRFRRLKPSRRVKEEEEEEVMSRTRKKTPKKDVLCFENLRSFDLDRNSARSKIDRRVMSRWLDNDMTQPVRHDNKIQGLFKSFLRKTLFFKPYLTREEDADEVKVETEFTDDGGTMFEELYEDNICTLTENELAPRNVSDQEPMSPSECNDEVEDQIIFEENSNNLQPRSYIAQNNSLTYATVPKKLDMKMLKNTVWTLLDLDSKDKENSISNNRGTLLSSNIYTQLQDHLPDDIWKDTSPALVFLTLLHLANEKTLKLKATDSMTDVIVERG